MLATLFNKGSQIFEDYVNSHVAAINAYRLKVVMRNLPNGQEKVFDFCGQAPFVDTCVNLAEIRQAKRTPASYQIRRGGEHYASRPYWFYNTFSAPIETPKELETLDQSIVGLTPTSQRVYDSYRYLLQKYSPRDQYGREINIKEEGMFTHRGNETLAYLKAGFLLQYMQSSSQIESNE